MAYSGRYSPINKNKYKGDPDKITWRSLWERKVMEWCDLNPDVRYWNSEETVIPYICKTDGNPHRYFIDFTIEFTNNKLILVEVKPNSQTKPPKENPKARNRNKYLKEVATYAKNISKWEAAKEFAHRNGVEFQIWDENTLNSIGIVIPRRYPKKKPKKNA